MSEKRKSDDLLDPDYPQNAKLLKTSANRSQPLTREERIMRIRNIVKREFQRELNAKEQEVLEIDNRITQAQKLLLRVKYAVVSNYYHRKGMELPDSQAQQCVESLHLESTAPPPTERDQRAIHPALKSILGKTTVDFDEILKARPTREAAKTAKTSIKEKLRTKKEEKRLQRAMKGTLNTVICHDPIQKVPRHVEPNKVEQEIPQLNAARGGNQTKHLIAVGNTSKYVGDDKHAHGVTHKWLVYVKTKTQIPIERLVTKVRFFLHPSYRPNDIVDVSEPPFQLSRRGWGEFPIRLQVFFDPSLQQKPVQLVHNLVLDKSLTGLQTMGAETLVEIWLRTDHIQSTAHENQKANNTVSDFQSENDQNSENNDEIMDHIDDNLIEFLEKIENQTSQSLCKESERIEPTITIPTSVEEENHSIDASACVKVDSMGCDDDEVANLNTGTINNREVVDVQMKQEVNEDSMEGVDFHGFGTEASNAMQNSTIANSIVQPAVTISSDENPLKDEANGISGQLSANNMSCLIPAENIKPTLKSDETQVTGNVNNITSKQSSFPVKLSHLPPKTEPVKTIQPINADLSVQKTAKAPTIITAVNSASKQPIIFQRRLIKCIDKQGNVKYVQMLVKQTNPPVERVDVIPTSTNAAQKAIFITKSNGHAQDNPPKPVILNVAPKGSLNVPIIANGTNQQSIPVALQQTSNFPAPTEAQPQSHLSKLSTSKENNSNLSQANLQNSTNKNQVLVKNGKMYIKDPLQAKMKQQTRKQESLLKPQVSLLKPIVRNDNLSNCIRNDAKGVFNHTAIATDHDYTRLIGKCPVSNTVTVHKSVSSQSQQAILNRYKSSIVTVNSPNNSRINVRVTKLDDEEDDEDSRNGYRSDNREGSEGSSVREETDVRLTLRGSSVSKSTVLMQKPRRNFDGELKAIFSRSNFVSVRQGVEFVMQRLPMINSQASSIDYSSSFPFIVKNQNVFDSLLAPKLRSNEWLRAKYIQRLLQNHPCIDKSSVWTTREIILFARLHAYTPVINYKPGKEFNDENKCASDRTLKDLINKEIKREKYDIQTLTLVHDTNNWINETRQKITEELRANEDVIDVDGINAESVASNASQHQLTPSKNMAGKYFYSFDKSLEEQASFVSDACQQIGIQLKPEEIVTDVLHPSTHLVLVQCLRAFVNDLLRRAVACRPHADVASSLIDTTIQPDDIKNAILHRPQWDFLTNNGLGVARPKE